MQYNYHMSPIKYNIIHLYYIICMYIYIHILSIMCNIYIYIPIWFWSCSSTRSLIPVSSTQSCSVSKETSAIRSSFGNRGLDYPKVREVSHPKLVFVMLFHHEIEDSSWFLNTNVVIVVESKNDWLVDHNPRLTSCKHPTSCQCPNPSHPPNYEKKSPVWDTKMNASLQ
jgi:hypothetical protein